MAETLDQQYLTWLYARIGSVKDRRRAHTHWLLFQHLYETQFIWIIPNDDNRVEDGRDMRYEFLDEMGWSAEVVDPAWMSRGCSVLELIFALSKHLAFEADRTPRYWFWVLIDNLGLHRYNDLDFDANQIDDIVNNLIWRTYSPDGRGGLFPLEDPATDQREVELWYQLSAYVLEHI